MKEKRQKESRQKTSKSTKTGNRRMEKDVMLRSIIDIFQKNPKAIYNYRQVSKLIALSGDVQKKQALDILYTLTEENILVESERGRFRYNSLGTIATGIFQRRSNGKNAFIPEVGAESIYVGRLQISNDYAFLVIEDKSLSHDIFIPKNKLNGGKNGEKATVKITEWPEDAKNPIGEVTDVLGVAGENNTEMNAILAEFGLPYRYPENVEQAATQIPEKITDEALAAREDFRDVTTFTIDPKDAKDFDDALSLRPTAHGHWEVGVHIADVTHYVRPDDVIDREAFNRATSVYLVDRTIPMLPEQLSNKLCSLRQDEDKLCFSVVLELNEKVEVLASRIARTVIRSNRRFTYEEVQSIIETGEGDYKDELLKLNELAVVLRNRRFANGAIDFDRYEVQFEIDDRGKPLSVSFKESKEANHLVEEFMLLANRNVAEAIGKNTKGKIKKTFVYRVHEQPDPDKMQNFVEFIGRFGYKMKISGSKSDFTKSINNLLDKSKGKPEQNLIETLAIRSMQKARYSVHNTGHYGLAFPFYTHFTSPIRRYPDMMVHRLLASYLQGGRSVNSDAYEDLCDHCSAMEQLAANAERASVKYKQVEFMSDKIGQVFNGVISGVTEWGLYVELNANKCEGLIPMRELNDDFYTFDEQNYCLTGKRHKHIYRLGDTISVKIAQANLQRKQLDFIPMD